jgi:peptidase M28-like protein/PDZ domain-containing protein/PA domain-containing protein
MAMKTLLLIVALVAAGVAPNRAQVATASRTRAHVETLASDKFGGRAAGSDGERLAAEYIVSQLTRIGARPLPGRSDMFQPFEFTAGSRDGGSRISVGAGDGVRALSFSEDATVEGEVVFAGYGLVVPESANFGYDSYAGLDVTDKIVLVFRYFPEDADAKTKAALAGYADLRYKANAARQRGAKAMLVVTGPSSPNAGELVPMTFDTAIAGSGIPAVSITGPVASVLFKNAKDQRPLSEVQKDLDSGNPHVAGFPLNTRVSLTTRVVREKRTARNVVAYLPATAANGVQKPWVVVGAHYDHLGTGAGGNSLASREEAGRPHVGADDNASGTASVIALAEALSKQPQRKRNLLIALWSAEEIGLIGSKQFVTTPPVPVDQIEAYVNFDMVGRMKDNRLAAQATGTSPIWASLIERANVRAGFDIAIQPDPYQPTDVSSFNDAMVPSLSFTTGAHSDYHKPSDTADKINYEDLDRVVDLATAITRQLLDLDAPPQFTKVEQSSQTASRTGLRVFTGTVPDYTAELKGLLLGGVGAGGPAEKAGLQKGDIIVEIAGQSITNIYDYTFALELLKIDQPVKVVYTRAGKRIETTLTPTARK